MKKFTLVVVFFIASFTAVQAQEYYTGIGLRWGKMNSGITMKHFFNADNATGAQLDIYRSYIYSRGYTLKLFFIKQNTFRLPLLQISLDYIYGFGLHAGYFPYTRDVVGRLTYCHYTHGKCLTYDKSVVTIGIDATLQIEYAIPMHDLPITISIDTNPWFEFLNPGAEWIDAFGISARYVFK